MRLPGSALRTIRARVTLMTAALLMTVLGLVAWLVDDAFRRQATANLDNSLAVETEAIASLVRVERGRLALDVNDTATLARYATPRGGAYYVVSSPGKETLLSPSLAGLTLEGAGAKEETGAAAARRFGSAVGPHEEQVRWHAQRLSVVDEWDDEPAPSGAASRLPVEVCVARSMAELREARASVRGGLLLALPVGLLVGTVAAWLLARRATFPIGRLSEEAHAIGTAGSPARLDTSRVEGELRDLADTLNQAFARLTATVEREHAFASNASHELKTPLAVLRSRVEVTLSRERSVEEYRAALRTALVAESQLEQVTDALLLLARLDSGRVARTAVDLRGIVARAVDAAGARQDDPTRRPRMDLPDAPVIIEGDGALLERLVAGLVENSMTHGEGKQVEVRLAVSGEHATMAVLDHGPGFPEDFLPRLFQRFARGDASRTRATGGAGLGLSIAQSITAAHGGTIVAGPRPGGGAEVVVTLSLRGAASVS